MQVGKNDKKELLGYLTLSPVTLRREIHVDVDIPSVIPITLTYSVVKFCCLATNHKVINQL